HNMVRILTGTLVEVGCGKIKPEDITKALESTKRSDAGITAPPQGLFLVSVEY
ncbi:MAG: tRNA pseudouridine(38-40) synthase TruA, partial [Anaerostipes hadrus]|nr:tRNA pseudouridine(38-40) synthase TruA [Anaerostipes hadrus]